MKSLSSPSVLALFTLALVSAPHSRAQSVFTEWDFDNLAVATNLTPGTNEGSGTASTLGMGLFTGPDKSDVTTQAGTDSNNTSASNQVWRVRGNNGWNSGAAIGTQGAQFMVSTAGESNITGSFDIMVTAQGEANFQVQYTTDGTDWINAAVTTTASHATVATNSSNANIVTGTYVQTTEIGGTDTWFNGIDFNLSGVTAANNDPNFGIRVVNAATGAADTSLAGGALNNTSGNWRFDNVEFSGNLTPVPEPSTWALILGCAVFAAAIVRRRFAHSA